MATAKKTTKKTSVKRAPAKPTKTTTVKHTSARTTRKSESFRVAKRTEPFFTFRVTNQTIYWSVLAIIVLALGLWVIDINDRVQRIYDQVDTLNSEAANYQTVKKAQQ